MSSKCRQTLNSPGPGGRHARLWRSSYTCQGSGTRGQGAWLPAGQGQQGPLAPREELDCHLAPRWPPCEWVGRRVCWGSHPKALLSQHGPFTLQGAQGSTRKRGARLWATHSTVQGSRTRQVGHPLHRPRLPHPPGGPTGKAHSPWPREQCGQAGEVCGSPDTAQSGAHTGTALSPGTPAWPGQGEGPRVC